MHTGKARQPELEIVRTLRRHKKELPITFLADVLKETVPATRKVVRRLVKAEIVAQNGDSVQLLME